MSAAERDAATLLQGILSTWTGNKPPQGRGRRKFTRLRKVSNTIRLNYIANEIFDISLFKYLSSSVCVW